MARRERASPFCARVALEAPACGRSASPLDGMSAYKDALHLDGKSADDRVRLAADLLRTGEGVVVLEGRLALRPLGGRIICEVIDAWFKGEHSHAEYKAMVDVGKSLLSASRLASVVPSDRLDWVVVSDYGTGTVELWRAV
jgi:hypothetical protein